MTTIALFGATGKLGRRVLTRALDAGYDVRALVRDPAKLDVILTESDNPARRTRTPENPAGDLEVIAGDVRDPAAVECTIDGAEVVLALFGNVKGSPATVQTDGIRNIVRSMQRHGLRRLISLSGGGLRDEQNDRPKLPDRAIRGLMKVVAADVLADAERHLDVLRGSGLDWTVVRGPRLMEEPGTGAYRVGSVGVDASTKIPYDDLADFVLTQIDDRSHVQAMPFVSS